MNIQREADLMLRRAHNDICYAEEDVFNAATGYAKEQANAALAIARRALAEAVGVNNDIRHFVLRPYFEGRGPAFRIIATSWAWELFILPVKGGPILLAKGDDYPAIGGRQLPYDEPATIGILLDFIVSAHPQSGSGIAADNCWAAHGWISEAALNLAAPYLDALEMEARDLENPWEPEESEDYEEGPRP